MKILCFFLVIVSGFPGNSFSQNPNLKNTVKGDTSNNLKSIDEIFDKELSENISGRPDLPQGIPWEVLDQPTREKFMESLKGYFQYRTTGYQHRQNVFEWQLLSSKITFIVVVLLVLAGMYLSGVQFYSSLKLKQSEKVPAKEEITALEASIRGIKVSSPILGVIILVFSLLFFYLYLVHVYPIAEIF